MIAVGLTIDTPAGVATVTAVDAELPRETHDAFKGTKVSAITADGEPWMGRWLVDCQPWEAA